MGRPSNSRSGRKGAPRLSHANLAKELAKLGREFHKSGWALGTSGNYSVVLKRSPLRLLITSTGLDKSVLTGHDIIEITNEVRMLFSIAKNSRVYLLYISIEHA